MKTVARANKLERGNRFHCVYPSDETYSVYTVKSVSKIYKGKMVRVEYVDDNKMNGYCEMPSQEPVYIYR